MKQQGKRTGEKAKRSGEKDETPRALKKVFLCMFLQTVGVRNLVVFLVITICYTDCCLYIFYNICKVGPVFYFVTSNVTY